MALVNAEKAQEAAAAYLEVALPVNATEQRFAAARKQTIVDELSKMAPVPLSSITFGKPIGDAPLKKGWR